LFVGLLESAFHLKAGQDLVSRSACRLCCFWNFETVCVDPLLYVCWRYHLMI